MHAHCPLAARAGVRRGTPLTDALASLPGGVAALVEPATPERDANALRALAERLTRFSPVVAPDGADGILLDIAGCEHLFGGEAAMVREVARSLRRLGLHCRVAVASTFACARAVSRYGPHDYASVPPGREADALAPLPLRALCIGDETAEALAELGVRSIGQAMHLRRRDLPVRFGDALLLRLDEAMGRALESIEPVRPSPPPTARRDFEGPSTAIESISLATLDQLRALCDLLRGAGHGARLLRVRLDRVGPKADPLAQPIDIEINLARPSRDARHLWTMLRPRIETVNMGFGVEAVEIVALRTGRLRHAQTVADFDESGVRVADECALHAARAELIDALTARLGADAVVRAVARESHTPERAYSLIPAAAEEPRQTARLTNADRPTKLFDRPEPVDAVSLVPDGPVMSVRWRGVDRRIVSSVGPERVGPEWWVEGERDTRDYTKALTDDGRWIWLFRRLRDGAWFVHGEWA